MEEEMEDANDVDFDYEFDAARYFELGRLETPDEAREAERWFEFARSYPPSPFVSKKSTVMDFLKENVITLPKLNDELHVLNSRCNGLTSGHTSDTLELKSIEEEDSLTCSTLLSPTASQLAKQNKSRDLGSSKLYLHRLPKSSSVKKIDAGLLETIYGGFQASKRQKLEGGNAQKVYHTQPDVNLLRKCLQKKREPSAIPFERSRLKITIPRAPELRTAKRADRIRSNSSKTQADCASRTICTFKARPLNRKILEGPSLPLPQKTIPKLPQFQVFHLKTSERAAQLHTLQLSPSLAADNHVKPFPQNVAMTVMQSNDGMCNDLMHIPSKFQARRVNSKVVSRRGDLGVFHGNKREFDFANDKRHRPLPPTELFNKLTLEPEDPQCSKSTRFSRPYDGSFKCRELKENILCHNPLGKFEVGEVE